jgi:hypothetical protein
VETPKKSYLNTKNRLINMVEIQCRECKAKIDVLNKRFKMCSDCSRNKKLNRCKTYKQRNKEKIKEYNKTWKEQNKKEVSEYNKNYAIQNKEQIRLRTNKHMKYKRDTDINYKMKITMRNRFRKFYLGKSISSKEVIGCSKDFFVKWIEFNFIGDMSLGKSWFFMAYRSCFVLSFI